MMNVNFINEIIDLIENMDEDLMDFYQDWQNKRPIAYPKSGNMRAIRKYVEDFRGVKERLESMIVSVKQLEGKET